MAAPASSSGGVSTIKASAGSPIAAVAIAEAAKEAWFAMRRAKPRFGVAYTQLRITRTGPTFSDRQRPVAVRRLDSAVRVVREAGMDDDLLATGGEAMCERRQPGLRRSHLGGVVVSEDAHLHRFLSATPAASR